MSHSRLHLYVGIEFVSFTWCGMDEEMTFLTRLGFMLMFTYNTTRVSLKRGYALYRMNENKNVTTKLLFYVLTVSLICMWFHFHFISFHACDSLFKKTASKSQESAKICVSNFYLLQEHNLHHFNLNTKYKTETSSKNKV